MSAIFRKIVPRKGTVWILLPALLIFSACSDSNPAAPDTGRYYPVQQSSQLAGRWKIENVFAGGLPLANLLVPGATAGAADSRLTMFGTDLNISPSGQYTGVFSNDVQATAADTADPSATVSGGNRTVGGYTLWGEGQIEILITAENGKTLPASRRFLGSASTLGDTLLLEFHFAVPPQKAVFFLPDTMSFLGRLVRR